jgi:hypothetical protein
MSGEENMGLAVRAALSFFGIPYTFVIRPPQIASFFLSM